MKVIGLMSGTSGDGIDAALCEITGTPPLIQIDLLATCEIPYDEGIHNRIWESCDIEKSRVDALCKLNFELGERFAQAVHAVVDKTRLTLGDIDLIGSHGQTVWHEVNVDIVVEATLQITEPAVIAERTRITTISNFRTRDVAAGGQGAPLVSYLDWLVLRHPDKWRAAQNIGGIANTTFLPPLSDTQSAPLALDTGPGNCLIDAVVYEITGGAQAYDRDGAIGQQGQIDESWLDDLLMHPYFALGLPKTTGRELFGISLALDCLHQGRLRGLDDNSIVATLTALTARSIADACVRFPPHPIDELLVSGGGTRNPYLMELLARFAAPINVMRVDDIGMSGDFKEAMLFALLAYETWHNRPGNMPSLTGARSPVVMGQITPGDNYTALLKHTWCD